MTSLRRISDLLAEDSVTFADIRDLLKTGYVSGYYEVDWETLWRATQARLVVRDPLLALWILEDDEGVVGVYLAQIRYGGVTPYVELLAETHRGIDTRPFQAQLFQEWEAYGRANGAKTLAFVTHRKPEALEWKHNFTVTRYAMSRPIPEVST